MSAPDTCACQSRSPRECMALRHPATLLGPQPDGMEEYDYMRAEDCECQCHRWYSLDDADQEQP